MTTDNSKRMRAIIHAIRVLVHYEVLDVSAGANLIDAVQAQERARKMGSNPRLLKTAVPWIDRDPRNDFCLHGD
jgi:hypothetical protein